MTKRTEFSEFLSWIHKKGNISLLVAEHLSAGEPNLRDIEVRFIEFGPHDITPYHAVIEVFSNDSPESREGVAAFVESIAKQFPEIPFAVRLYMGFEIFADYPAVDLSQKE